MSALKIDARGTLDVTSLACPSTPACWAAAVSVHGSSTWANDDLKALEATLCQTCAATEVPK